MSHSGVGDVTASIKPPTVKGPVQGVVQGTTCKIFPQSFDRRAVDDGDK
jgi:hypothetical protein